jgi:putative spermidine/putrescine transport system permease protein
MTLRRSPANACLLVAACLIGVFLLVPTLMVIPMSLSSSRFWIFPIPALSLRWYREFLSDPEWLGSLTLSLRMAAVAAAAATAAGVSAAWTIVRSDLRSMKILGVGILLPLLMPLIALAASCYFLFSRLGWVGSPWAMAMVHAVLALPTVALTTYLGILSIDIRVEWAARSLGATTPAVFFLVVLPQLWPSVLLAYLLAFGISMDEIVIANFLAGTSAITLPKRMFDGIRFDVDPKAAVAAVCLLAITLLIVVVSSGITRLVKGYLSRTQAAPGEPPAAPSSSRR